MQPRRRWFGATALVVAVATLIAACGGGASATRSSVPPPPAPIQLRLADLPGGFYMAVSRVVSPTAAARAAGLDAGQYLRQGGGPSRDRVFLLRHPATEGITLVSSQIFAFRSPGSAAWGFQQLRTALALSGTIGTNQVHIDAGIKPTPVAATIVVSLRHPVAPPATPYEREHVPAVGNEDAGFKNTSAAYAGEYVFDNQVVLFRRGRYCAFVHLSGNYAQVPLQEALALVRRIDSRITS